VNKDERRMFERFRVDFPIKFVRKDDKKEGSGRVIDISASGGGLIVTAEELSPPVHLEMWLFIPDNHDPLYTNGRVIWSKKIEENLYRAGVEFDKVDFMGVSRALRIFRSRSEKNP
jgi:hypothetical protein